jgi:RNA-binding protein YhbY
MLASEFGNAVLDMMEDFTTGDPNGGDSAESLLDYTLTDADHEKFTQLLAECETLVLDGTDIAAIETAIEKMEEQYYHIVTQAQIAYLLYCRDVLDDELSDDQLYASEMQSDTYGEYIEFAKKVDASDSPYRDTFFSDWSEADIAVMHSYTDEMTALTQANDALLAREIIKCRVLENSMLSAREACEELSRATHSEQVQVIGTKFVLFKFQPDLSKRKIELVKDTKKKKV